VLESCTGENSDLKLDSKAGLDRTAVTYKDSDVWSWSDFEAAGFTRTGSDDWFSEVP
jgi:hypothetical protein